MNWSKKGALLGTVFGALGGGALGYLAGAGTKSVGTQTLAGVIIVGALGAAGGAFVPPMLEPASNPNPTQLPPSGA